MPLDLILKKTTRNVDIVGRWEEPTQTPRDWRNDTGEVHRGAVNLFYSTDVDENDTVSSIGTQHSSELSSAPAPTFGIRGSFGQPVPSETTPGPGAYAG